MKTRHFLMMATLAVGIAMTSMMMTSCSKADNPVDTPMDSPNVLPVGALLEDDVPCQFKSPIFEDKWHDWRVTMQYRVISQGKNPEVKLIRIFLRDWDNKIFIPDTVVGYWGEEYKVTQISLQDFSQNSLYELHTNHYIRDIGQEFKECTRLKKVDLSKGVMHIISNAFQGCTSLEELHLSGNTFMEEDAFEGCKNLKYVIFHSNHPYYEQIWFPEGVEFFTEEQWNDRNQGN